MGTENPKDELHIVGRLPQKMQARPADDNNVIIVAWPVGGVKSRNQYGRGNAANCFSALRHFMI